MWAALGERFRLPAEDDAPPPPRRMAGLCVWAGALALIGLIPAVRLGVSLIFGGGPGWYAPVTILVGVLGVGATAAAFASIHRARLPWYLLGCATFLLAVNVLLAAVA
jgi:hypothetical protein